MIIDANVFKGYFQATLGENHDLCGCPLALFGFATSTNPIYQDAGGIIESEWLAVVDPEWFNVWLANQLTSGVVTYIEPKKDLGFEKNLFNLGFPRGRDIIYIRVGMAVTKLFECMCELFTEDLDFYDPTMKKCPSITRQRILSSSKGPIAKLLKRNNIQVFCVP